jgi:ribonuclease Z
MVMEIVFLGTSSMVPTKERNHSGMLLRYGTEGILFDCGEGIQRQFKIGGISPTTVTKILISHWHGDHVLGLPGLIQTLSASEYGKTLAIYGPKGTKERIKHMFQAFVFDKNIELDIFEVKEGVFVDTKLYKLEALPLEHGVETLGYRFVEKDKRKINVKSLEKLGIKPGPIVGKLQDGESVMYKGKKISPEDVSAIVKGKVLTYITDTRLCDNCFALAHQADILVCESTYSSKLEGKGEEYSHMTASQAAEIASKAGVGKLILTHFSARYKKVDELEDEAKQAFENTTCAYDFLKVKI